MQASAFSIKAKSVFPHQDRSFLRRRIRSPVVSGGDFGTTKKANFCRISVGPCSMGGRESVQSLNVSSAKTRSLKVQASGLYFLEF